MTRTAVCLRANASLKIWHPMSQTHQARLRFRRAGSFSISGIRNPERAIVSRRAGPTRRIPIGLKTMENIMSSHPARKWRNIRRALGTMTFVFIALAYVLPQAALGANPIEDLAKQKSTVGGGLDPHVDSWQSMQHS